MARFPDGARVCFVGDSNTHDNRHLARIVDYYREYFPQAKVEFYNCGISGATLRCTLNSFDEDIRTYAPTHVVLEMGGNDAKRSALNNSPETRYDIVEASFEEYKRRLDTFCQRVRELGAELTLCTILPYAEYIQSETKPTRGGYALSLAYAEYLRGYAKEHGYPLCDYHAHMTRMLQTEELYRPDRVHQLARGQYQRAKCFLAFQGYELGEEKELPEDITKWHEVVQKVRNTIATEHFILEDDFTTTDEQRMAAIQNWLATEQTGPYANYFRHLCQQYVEIKKDQQENIKFVLDFMKNQ